MHVLPQLRKLEERYPQELVVLGVHSAKFPEEREGQNLRQAVLRYDIRHPVANDKDFTIWRQYAVRAWPSLYLIDPRGTVLGKHEGEFVFEQFDQIIAAVLKEYDGRGLVQRRPETWRLERDKEAAAHAIAFPGKVLADQASGRLFIADSGHHRIVVADLAGAVQAVIGGGGPGLEDGDYAQARFHSPQGMALAGDALYVADTENHVIRRVDLAAGRVATVAGTGQQGMYRAATGPARQVALRSPWDLAVLDGLVYIAMAGSHQVWLLDPRTGSIGPLIGNGHEGIQDGPLAQAMLAQPSGIATDGRRLFFADSETSSIRMATLGAGGQVTTLVGVDLFDFGDVDGAGPEVRLQHPLGVAWHDGALLVADTYNNKVKRLHVASRETRTLFGDATPGLRDGVGTGAQLYEPGGVSVAGGRVYVADTNNHAVRVGDLAALRLDTLDLRGL